MIGQWTLAALQQVLGESLSASLRGDATFLRVCTDTRTLRPGDLFLALRGPNFDGHRFLRQAREAGAVAAVVDNFQHDDLPQWQVSDTRIALGQIARLNRERFTGPVYAVTGSSGKTTVKEMLACVLAQASGLVSEQASTAILATKGNLNNDIGAPLTLLSLNDQHQQAVIELGASAGGEIAYTAALAQPHIAILNNAMGAHLEGFGSLQGVVRAKGEIFSTLTRAADNWAIINLDDPNAAYWLALTSDLNRLTFGVDNHQADIQASNLQLLNNGCYRFTLLQGEQQAELTLPVMGRHMVANATAVAAACSAGGLSLQQVARGLEAVTPVPGRMCPHQGYNGALLIDDSYNANPCAVKAAIDVLVALPGLRVLVLGDMGELGDEEATLHAEVGRYAAQQGVDRLLAKGPLSAHTVAAFNTVVAGADAAAAQLTDSHEELIDNLRALCSADCRVLVKGSRSAAMERVVDALTEGV
ncbi:MAG: UDP-N-acetylmuramoyl-tripeptide--D-alanyl-D-alanine ligase [Marinobacterium sp.]|nr:UDP-N-acetylmuramoyl-tripeptide--D-alanyl-D-alanine ligase [Marinobacterium sp.]